MSKSMTEGNPLELILKFALPLLMGNLFQQTYNMVDTAIVGRTLGASALASVGASSSVQFLVLGFCMGICAGFAIPVAQRFGAKDYTGMRRFEWNGILWIIFFGVVLTTATVILCPQILQLLQTPADIFADARKYLTVIFIGIPCTLLYNYLSGILRSIGDSKTPFMFLAFSSCLNIALDFFCILVLKWGVAGAAIATIFSQGVSGILCALLIAKKFDVLHMAKEDRQFSPELSRRLLAMGLPMGLNWSITAIGSMTMQSANNGLGTVYVSAFTAGLKIKQLMMCPFDAIATAVTTFVSQNYGARQMDRVKQGIRTGATIGILYGLAAGVILFFFGRTLSMMFVSADQAEILDAAHLYLRRLGYFYWVLGILNIFRNSMQGLGYSSRAAFAGVTEMVARVAVVLLFVPSFGFDAITFTDQAAWILGTLYVVPSCLMIIRHIEEQMANDNINLA